MVGIYKITNKINGKFYIGQSNDIERRFNEHCTKWKQSRIPLDLAIHKYGKENFLFEVLEECDLEELNQKETDWIIKLNAVELGYNCNKGGDSDLIGSFNPNAKLTEEDVKQIRIAYNNHISQKETYDKIAKDKITWNSFQNVWQGRSWKHIMPEVFTEENKKYYMYQATNGEKSAMAILTNEEVLSIRQRYVTETAKTIYKDYSDRISYQTLQQILWGRYYKDLPVYSKKQKKWV